MSFAEKHNILIIDNNFLIKEVIKTELQKLGKQLKAEFDFYSADNGVQGLGYLYSISPDLIIIDTTLPDYSGRDILEFILTNKRYSHSKVIVLTHEDRKDLPLNFVEISKRSVDFLGLLLKQTQKLLHPNWPAKKASKKAPFANWVVRMSNFSDLVQHRTSFILFPTILETAATLLYSLYMIRNKRGSEFIKQEKLKNNLRFGLKVYPSLGMLFTSFMVILLQLSIFLGVFAGFFSAFNKHVYAASYTWDGGGTDGTCGGNAGDGNKWSCAANWSSDIVPVAGDTVTFNGTSTKNATIDASFQGTVSAFTISAGYTGTITLQRSLTVNGAYAQSDGTLNASNQTLDFNSTFTLNTGSTFTASSATTFFGNAFTINGGTFNHNSGTATFDSIGSISISCNSVTFNFVTLTGGSNTKTVSSNCTFPLGNNPSVARYSINGTLTGTGTLTFTDIAVLGSTGSLSGFSTLVANSTFTHSGGSTGTITSFTAAGAVTVTGTWNTSSFTTFDLNSSLTINPTVVFTAPTGTMTLAGALTVDGTFNGNAGLLTLDGAASTVTIQCGGTANFSVVSFAHTGSAQKTVTCNLPLGNNPSTSTGSINLQATLSGTGTFTIGTGGLLINSGGISGFTGIVANGAMTTGASVTLNFSSYSIVDFNSSFSSGGPVTASSGTMTFASTFTLSSTFTHNNGTVTFDGTTSATLSCNSQTFNLVTFAHTTGTKTVSANCTFPLGNNPTLGSGSAIVTLSGILSGTGTLTGVGTLTLNSGASLSGFTAFAGSLTASTGSSIGSVNAIAGGAISLGITLDASVMSSFTASTLAISAGTFTSPITLNMTTGGLTVSGGTFIGGTTLTSGTVSLSSGATLTAPSGTWTLQGNLTFNSGSTFNHNNGIITWANVTNVVFNCGNKTFNQVNISTHSGFGTRTVSSDCVLPLGNNPTIFGNSTITLNGTLTGSGNLNQLSRLIMNTSTALVTGFTSANTAGVNYINGTFASSITSLTLTSSWNNTGNFIASVNAPGLTTLTINNDLNINASSSFTSPPTLNVTRSFSVNSGGTFIPAGGTVNFSGTLSGTITCTGTYSFSTVNFTHTTGSKTVAAGCVIPLANGSIIPQSVTLNGTLTGTGTVTFTGGTFTQAAGSTISNFTVVTNDAPSIYTFTGGSFSNVGKFVLNDFGLLNNTVNINASFNASGIGELDTNAIFTIKTGTTFTAPPIWHAGSVVQFVDGATFVHNNGTFIIDNLISSYQSTGVQCTNSPATIFNTVQFVNTLGDVTISYCDFNIGNNPTLPGGVILTVGASLDGTGTLTADDYFEMNNGGTVLNFNSVIVNGDSLLSTPTFTNVGQLTLNGTTTIFTYYATDLDALTSNGRLDLGNQWGGGWFVAPASLTVNGDFNMYGESGININNSTVTFSGSSDAVITCNNTQFGGSLPPAFFFTNAVFTHTTSTKTIGEDCVVPLGTNPTVTGSLVIQGEISGSNKLTDTGDLYFGPTGNVTGFDEIEANAISLDGSTIDLSATDTLSLHEGLTLNSGSTLTAPTLIQIDDIWTNVGTFNHNNGTVKFNTSSDKSITGSTTFYNFTFDPVNDPIVYFEAGETQVVEGTLTLKGQAGNLIYLQSTTPGTEWFIDPQGPRVIEYVEPSDSHNINAAAISVFNTGSVDGGNNTGWDFWAPSVTNLGPISLTDGSSSTNKTPTFTFNVNEPVGSDSVGFRIQIDNNVDFSSPVVDYTSNLDNQGYFSFTVGQALLGGTYNSGLEGQQLEPGSYYWRVLGFDEFSNTSGYVTVNSGNIAFIISTGAIGEPVITKIDSIILIPNSDNLIYYIENNKPNISGDAEAGSTVFFKKGSITYSTTTDSSGHFSITLDNPELADGTNTFQYYAQLGDTISGTRTLTLVVGCKNFPDYLKLLHCPLSLIINDDEPGTTPVVTPPLNGLPTTGTGGNSGKPLDSTTETIKYYLLLISPLLIAAIASIGGAIATGLLLEILKRTGVFVGSIIPKKRKYWGIVYDEIESKGIAFAIVRLYKGKIVKSMMVTDIQGRYGLLVDEPGIYNLEVQSSGFEPYSAEIDIKKPDEEIILDIKMERVGKLNIINRIKFYARNELFTILNIVWIICMLVGLAYTTKESYSNPTQINLMIIALYFLLLLINIGFMLLSRINQIGKVLEKETRSPINNVIVRFYQQQRQIDLAITNNKGALKINMKPGKYTLNAYKEGYKQIDPMKEIEVDQKGHIAKDITLQKSESKVDRKFTM